MDLEHATLAHQQFKSRLNQFIGGSLREPFDPVAAGRDDRCELGLWLKGEGRRLYRNEEAFRQLELVHAQFHEKAGKVAKLAAEGDTKQAQALFDASFHEDSREIALAIRRLRKPTHA